MDRAETNATKPYQLPDTRLDSIAKILAGATAAVAGLLTTFGLTSDRIWVLLDREELARWIILCGGLAVLAITCSLVALFMDRFRWLQGAILTAGTFFYIAALVGVILVAGRAGNVTGRPRIESVSVISTEAGQVLEVKLVADRMDIEQTISVRIDADDDTLYNSVVAADANGAIAHTVRLPVGRTSPVLQVVAWRTDRGEPDCERVKKSGPACASVRVPSDEASSTTPQS